jgi:hypothetical protein
MARHLHMPDWRCHAFCETSLFFPKAREVPLGNSGNICKYRKLFEWQFWPAAVPAKTRNARQVSASAIC